MSELRVVCYLNQFFGQIGGEDKAGVAPRVLREAAGGAPGRPAGPPGPRRGRGPPGARGQTTPRRGVATVVAAATYVAEREDGAIGELVELVAAEKPALLVAGPTFRAGRYGVACGALCAAVQARLGVPAVTGMHPENPGVEMYRRR